MRKWMQMIHRSEDLHLEVGQEAFLLRGLGLVRLVEARRPKDVLLARQDALHYEPEGAPNAEPQA